MGDKKAALRRFRIGILVVLAFIVVAAAYLIVMTGTAEVHGTVHVQSRLLSEDQTIPANQERENIFVNGYCLKGPEADCKMLLSTKSRIREDLVEYSFEAKSGMRHMIVVYLKLDQLSGATDQTLELCFVTSIIKNANVKRNFEIALDRIGGVDSIIIAVEGSDLVQDEIFAFPLAEVPETIKL